MIEKHGQPMYHSVGFASPLCLVYSHDILMTHPPYSPSCAQPQSTCSTWSPCFFLPGCATAATAVAVQPWRAWGYPLQGPVLHSPAIQGDLRKHALARACWTPKQRYFFLTPLSSYHGLNGFTWKWVYPFCCNWNWENDEKHEIWGTCFQTMNKYT